jgi:hypothetical protein
MALPTAPTCWMMARPNCMIMSAPAQQSPNSARTQPMIRSSSSASIKDIKNVTKNNINYPPNEKTIIMNQNKNIEIALK